jgi:hypothetical protein
MSAPVQSKENIYNSNNNDYIGYYIHHEVVVQHEALSTQRPA